jgi:quercetin dioxygenase-like cupin family protein
VVEIREGEQITGDGEMDVALLADLEQLAVADIRSRPYCGDTPPAHTHHGHAEAFYVLDGELELRLEDGERRVGPDTWVFVPPGIVHTIVVTGEERAHLLDLHLPGSGYGDFVRGLHAARSEDDLRAVRAAFDQQPAPDYGGVDPGLVVLRRTGGDEGETIGGRSPDRRATLLVDADELTVTEFAYGPGERGAEPHVHRHHADGFLVVEGEFTFTFRDGPLAISEGTLVLFPPGVVHGFDNDSTAAARCFNFHMPSSGFAEYLRGRNPDFDQLDPPEDGGVDPAAVVAVRLSQ